MESGDEGKGREMVGCVRLSLVSEQSVSGAVERLAAHIRALFFVPVPRLDEGVSWGSVVEQGGEDDSRVAYCFDGGNAWGRKNTERKRRVTKRNGSESFTRTLSTILHSCVARSSCCLFEIKGSITKCSFISATGNIR